MPGSGSGSWSRSHADEIHNSAFHPKVWRFVFRVSIRQHIGHVEQYDRAGHALQHLYLSAHGQACAPTPSITLAPAPAPVNNNQIHTESHTDTTQPIPKPNQDPKRKRVQAAPPHTLIPFVHTPALYSGGGSPVATAARTGTRYTEPNEKKKAASVMLAIVMTVPRVRSLLLRAELARATSGTGRRAAPWSLISNVCDVRCFPGTC
jgi:hypothetical protein